MEQIKPHITIMHAPWIPERVVMFDNLLDELGGVSEDLSVVKAVKGAGIWDTARRSWRDCPEGFTHQIVIQDDAWPCLNFRGGLRATLAVVPTEVVSYFYTSNSRVACDLFAKDKRWYIGTLRGGGVCLSLPRQVALDFADWADENVLEKYPHDDARLGLYCAEFNLPVYHPIPSLVEHLGRESTWNKAMNKRGPAGGYQFASLWLGEEDDPEEMDWHSGSERPENLGILPTRVYGNKWRKPH